MLIVIFLLIVWLPYLVRYILISRHRRAAKAAPPSTTPPLPPIATTTDTPAEEGLTWSPLDDRQLTRLLIDSAPHTSTEQDL